jgi:hypothetical protein
MSVRSLFADGKVDYLLPASAGAQVGNVLTLGANNTLEFAAGGGGGGGLTQADVYGAGEIYELPVLATAQAGQLMTVQDNGGTNVLAFEDAAAGFLTAAEVFTNAQPYALPVLATAQNGQLLTVVGGAQNTLAYSAQAQGLTADQVYGNGNPVYSLPTLAGQNGNVATVAGGALTYAPLPPALTAAEVWDAGNAQYTLPDITGVPDGQSLSVNGTGDLVFNDITGAGLTSNQVYGNGNPAYAIGPIAAANDGDVLTAIGGAAVWQAPPGGLNAADVWQNTGAEAKIPDYSAAIANDVLTLTNATTGETAWVAPPGVPAAAIWEVPNTPYTLPALGNTGQLLAVNTGATALEYVDPPTVATTSEEVVYQAAFTGGGELVPAYVTFSRTADMVTCQIKADTISSDTVTGANLDNIVFEPNGNTDWQPYMPNNTGNPVFLNIMPVVQTSGAGFPQTSIGFVTMTPDTGNFQWVRYAGAAMVTDSEYEIGTTLDAFVQLGAWAIITP